MYSMFYKYYRLYNIRRIPFPPVVTRPRVVGETQAPPVGTHLMSRPEADHFGPGLVQARGGPLRAWARSRPEAVYFGPGSVQARSAPLRAWARPGLTRPPSIPPPSMARPPSDPPTYPQNVPTGFWSNLDSV